MKFKTMIAIGVGTLAIGATSLAVVANTGSNSQVGADSTVTLYLQVGSYWDTGSYGIWHWASGSGTWSSLMTSVTGVSGLYAVSISSSDINVIFAEFTSGTTTPAWGSKKYQTGDLTYGTNNLYTLTSTTAGTWSSYTPPVTYSITEYEVVNGTLNSTAIATETATGGVNFTPTDIAKSGYTMDGWYTDSACTTAYTATTWSAAGSLYAKYTAKVDYDVYFAVSGWSQAKIYTFGGDTHFGAWAGTAMSVTTGVNFLGLGGLYKATIPATSTDTKVVFNNGTGGSKGSTQTNDLKLTGKTALYWLSEGTDETGDLDKAYAAKVVFDINAARLAVTASSPILEKSYCGISKATATSLLQEYDALNDTAKAYVASHNNTDYTYNYSNPSGDKVDVEFSAIIAQLRLIAAGSGANYIAPTVDTNAWIFGAIAISGLAVGGLFLALNRKRKEN
jgi:hypothetical protein